MALLLLPEKCCNPASQSLGSALGLACSPSVTSNQDEQRTVDLPQHTEATFDGFIINGLTNTCSIELIQNTYDELVHFRPNAFQVPTGGVGNSFVTQLTTYLSCFGRAGPYEGIAIKVAMVYQQLLLQKPCGVRPDSAAACLKRRMELWNRGEARELLHECRTIHQQRDDWAKRTPHSNMNDTARDFASSVTSGKLKSAWRMLDSNERGGVLRLDDEIDGETVRDILKGKQPEAAPIQPGSVPDGAPPQPPHPILVAAITRDSIRRTALRIEGATGSSGVDAEIWRRMLTSFGQASDGLCDAVAACAMIRIATAYVDPVRLEAYTARRLIPLDNNPGVRAMAL
eukprot:scpid90746/ scgid25865/ 